MNQEIANKQQTLGKYQESLPKKIARRAITGFGAIMTAAGSYYMATAFVAGIAAPLLGTPIGWVLIALMITAGLGFYFSMQGKGMVQLLNPEYVPFKTLKRSLKNLICKNEHDFQVVNSLQERLNKNVSEVTSNGLLTDDTDKEHQILATGHTGLGFFKPIVASQNPVHSDGDELDVVNIDSPMLQASRTS